MLECTAEALSGVGIQPALALSRCISIPLHLGHPPYHALIARPQETSDFWGNLQGVETSSIAHEDFRSSLNECPEAYPVSFYAI